MTVLSAVQAAAVQGLALERPTVLYSGTTRELVELKSIANAAAESISREYDWQKLKRVATITGDGSQTAFSLRSDYDRMTHEARLWSDRFSAPLNHIVSQDQWQGLTTLGEFTTYGSWILYGGQIHIMPAPADGETITYFYMSNLYAENSGGTNIAEFSADDDTFRLDETLLKLAVIWMFKQQKGRPYAEDLATFEREKERRVARDGGSKILAIGQPRRPRDADIAWPLSVGT
jgi:hypothetical protein